MSRHLCFQELNLLDKSDSDAIASDSEYGEIPFWIPKNEHVMTAYVHVGQCGNQLGAAFWQLVGSDDVQDPVAPTKKQLSSTAQKWTPSPAPTAKKKPSPSLSATPPLFFRHFYHQQSRKARCVLVDTEPKVIRSLLASAWPSPSHQPAFVHYEQSGRGNNWAMGYNFQRFQRNVIPSKTEPRRAQASRQPPEFTPFDDDKRELVELAMDSLQKLVEMTDCFQGVVLSHSLGGGTGSGLGCRLMELIRDTYPRSYLVAASVAPSWKCGDTPLQNYNSVFTLAHLQEHADCVIYKENDELLRAAGYWKSLQSQHDQSQHTDYQSSVAGGSRKISIAELNHVAAADLAGLLFPMTSRSHSTSSPPPVIVAPFDFGKVLHDLCPMPSAKFLDVRTGVLRAKPLMFKATAAKASDPLFHAGVCQVPLLASRSASIKSDDEVEFIATKLFRQTAQSFPRSQYANLASSTIFRGFPYPSDPTATKQAQLTADAAFPGVAWDPEYQSVLSYSPSPPFASHGGKASVTICTNNGHVLTSAEQFLQRAQRQFHAKAYVHWYKQHGLEESHFLEAFEKCQRLSAEYKELLH